MNKKTVAIIAGTVILPMFFVSCTSGSGKTYSYEVSGVVEAAQVDYECEDDLALDPAFFVAGSTKPGGGKQQDRKKEPSRKGETASKTPANKTPSKTPTNTSGTSAMSEGVRLSKKPDKPERVTSIKPPKYKHKLKGCDEEYELFVKNGKGLFEQDVRKADYDNCSDRARERFPSCTKN